MKFLKTALFWMVQITLVVFLVEGVCYLFLKTSHNPLYRARRVLTQNANWGWQAKAHLKTEFENAALYTDAYGFRVEQLNFETGFSAVELVTLGPSSAFGWGVEAGQTYTAKTAGALNVNYLNAAQIGFSTLQGNLLWNKFISEKLPALKYAIVSYGVNDLDKFRFFDATLENDAAFFAKAASSEKLNSNFITVLDLFEEEFSFKRNCGSLRSIHQRLSLEKSVQNLKMLIEALKNRGVKVIVLSTPYQPMPKNGEFSMRLISAHYQNAEKSAQTGNCPEALSWLAKAKALEPWRVENDVSELAKLQEKLSREENVIFVDAHAALNAAEDFVDPVHPSVKGHELIANAILAGIK